MSDLVKYFIRWNLKQIKKHERKAKTFTRTNAWLDCWDSIYMTTWHNRKIQKYMRGI